MPFGAATYFERRIRELVPLGLTGYTARVSRSGSVMNRQAVPPKPATPAQSATPAAPAAPAAPAIAPPRSPWMGMLGGLALGAAS